MGLIESVAQLQENNPCLGSVIWPDAKKRDLVYSRRVTFCVHAEPAAT